MSYHTSPLARRKGQATCNYGQIVCAMGSGNESRAQYSAENGP